MPSDRSAQYIAPKPSLERVLFGAAQLSIVVGEFLFIADTPVGATVHLHTMPCDGNLIHELGYGSYLIWRCGRCRQSYTDE